MENGVPATAVLSLARSSGHVYDLVEGCALDAHVRDGRLTVAHTFGPCDGCVLMVTERAINAVRVDILDPAGAQAEGSGYYGTEHGQLTLTLDLAPNDRRGLWQISVRELASRRRATADFRTQDNDHLKTERGTMMYMAKRTGRFRGGR